MHPPTRPTGRPRRTALTVALAAACLVAGAAVTVNLALPSKEPPGVVAPEVAADPPGPARRAVPRGIALPLGTPAPEFTLPDVRTGERVSLSDYRSRPAVLLFGSFGCDVFCGQLAHAVRLSERYDNRAAFLFVYITDAPHEHPVLGRPPRYPDPVWIRHGLEVSGVPFRCLVDEDAEAEAAYAAYPQRLVVVGADGRVEYASGWGPGEWDLAAAEDRLRTAVAAAEEAE